MYYNANFSIGKNEINTAVDPLNILISFSLAYELSVQWACWAPNTVTHLQRHVKRTYTQSELWFVLTQYYATFISLERKLIMCLLISVKSQRSIQTVSLIWTAVGKSKQLKSINITVAIIFEESAYWQMNRRQINGIFCMLNIYNGHINRPPWKWQLRPNRFEIKSNSIWKR